jgi:hypothetical protein
VDNPQYRWLFRTLNPSLTLRVVIGRVSLLTGTEAMTSNRENQKPQLLEAPASLHFAHRGAASE